MIFFSLLVIIAGIAATVDAIVRDDRGQLPPPGSYAVDPAFLSPRSALDRR